MGSFWGFITEWKKKVWHPFSRWDMAIHRQLWQLALSYMVFWWFCLWEDFNKKERLSGAILAYYRSESQGKVSVYDKTSENIIWIKTDKGVNDYENNTVACVYSRPKSLKYTKFYGGNVTIRLEQQLTVKSSSDLI